MLAGELTHALHDRDVFAHFRTTSEEKRNGGTYISSVEDCHRRTRQETVSIRSISNPNVSQPSGVGLNQGFSIGG